MKIYLFIYKYIMIRRSRFINRVHLADVRASRARRLLLRDDAFTSVVGDATLRN